MKNNKYYANVIYKNVEITPLLNTNEDLSIYWEKPQFLTLNNGRKANPFSDNELEDKINSQNFDLSRKQLHSKSWYKIKLQIDKLKEKCTNRLKKLVPQTHYINSKEL